VIIRVNTVILFFQIGTIKSKRDKKSIFINKEKNTGFIHYEDMGAGMAGAGSLEVDIED
jgi:hypothetical protein